MALLIPKIVDVAIIFKAIGLIVSPIVLYVWLTRGNGKAIVSTLVITFCIVVVLAAIGFVRPELVFISLIGGTLVYALSLLVDKLVGKLTGSTA